MVTLEYLQPLRKGFEKAVKTVLKLAKIIVPVTFALVALDKIGWLIPVAGVFRPLLLFFGLPGEAALPLFLGFFVNIYASLGAIAVLSLTTREATVIALMILTSHSLMMEVPLLKLIGLRPFVSLPLRIITALTAGYLLNLVYLVLGG